MADRTIRRVRGRTNLPPHQALVKGVQEYLSDNLEEETVFEVCLPPGDYSQVLEEIHQFAPNITVHIHFLDPKPN